MSNISKETQQAIEKQALSIVDQYGKGSLYNKPGKKPQLTFFYDNEQGEKKRKTLSIPEGADSQQVKLEFIIQTLTKRYQLQQEQKKRQLLQETISKDFLEKVDKIVEALPETKKTLKPCTKTVAQVLDEYMENCRERKLSYAAIKHNALLGRRINQYLGDKKIKDLTHDDVQYMIYNMKNKENEEKPLSKVYMNDICAHIKRVLRFAKKKKYIDSYNDIVDNIEMPINLKKYNPDTRFLNYKEMAEVLYILKDNLKYYTIITVLTLTGLRSQELFALRKQDIDKENHRLYIAQALTMNERTDSNDSIHKVGTPKTDSSIRYVPTVDSVLNLIDKWLQYTEKEGIQQKAHQLGNQDLIFTDNKGRLEDPGKLLVYIHRFINRKLKNYDPEIIHNITFHSCRHCFATYLYREHCDLHIIQQCMGHTTKRGSVAEIHYIADDDNYVNIALPFLEIVEEKLIQACKELQHEYSSAQNN